MRSVLAAVLVCEAIVVGLAAPVAIAVADVPAGRVAAASGGIAAACLITCALLRTRLGIVVGSVLQLVTLGLGFVVPMMFVLGGIFGLLWFSCLVLDRRLAARGEPASEAP